MYSETKAREKKVGWYKGGKNIWYDRNSVKKELVAGQHFHTLTFCHTFEYDNDVVWFAYAVPYSFSDLRDDLDALEQDVSGHG